MKKLTALLLSAATILTLATPAFAVEENTTVQEQAIESQTFEIADDQSVQTAQEVIPDAQTNEESNINESTPRTAPAPDAEQSNSSNEDAD